LLATSSRGYDFIILQPQLKGTTMKMRALPLTALCADSDGLASGVEKRDASVG
jgi:hypothetical protein